MKNIITLISLFVLIIIIFSCKSDTSSKSIPFIKSIEGEYQVNYCTKGEKQFVTGETEDFGTIDVTKIEGGIKLEAKGEVQKKIPMSRALLAESEENPNTYLYSNAYGVYAAAIKDNELELLIELVYTWNRRETFIVRAEKTN